MISRRSDSGVEVSRVLYEQNEQLGALYRAKLPPAGVGHSQYSHRFQLRVYRETLEIEVRMACRLILLLSF